MKYKRDFIKMKTVLTLFALLSITGCNTFPLHTDVFSKDTANAVVNNSKTSSEVHEAESNQPVINVEPTLVRPQIFLMMRDQAEDSKEAHEKQKVIYNNLDYILKKNNLQPVGSPVAWYTNSPNLFVVEAGIPLTKKLHNPEVGTYYKETKRCKAVVAHFFGKRSLLPRAYDSLNVWLKENHQTAIGTPWEVYVSDPRIVKDHDFLQTDIYTQAK